jgi:hypothetical protein
VAALGPRIAPSFGVYCRGWEPIMSVAFDTLKFAQNLRDKANFSPEQAEGVSQAFSEAITGQLATRSDLADLATKDEITDLRKEMGVFRLQTKEDFARLEVKIEATRSEILRWMFGQTLLILGAVLAIGRIWH